MYEVQPYPFQASENPSLQCVQEMRTQNGSPLPVDQQLCWPLELQVLLLILAVLSSWMSFHDCYFFSAFQRINVSCTTIETPPPNELRWSTMHHYFVHDLLFNSYCTLHPRRLPCLPCPHQPNDN